MNEFFDIRQNAVTDNSSGNSVSDAPADNGLRMAWSAPQQERDNAERPFVQASFGMPGVFLGAGIASLLTGGMPMGYGDRFHRYYPGYYGGVPGYQAYPPVVNPELYGGGIPRPAVYQPSYQPAYAETQPVATNAQNQSAATEVQSVAPPTLAEIGVQSGGSLVLASSSIAGIGNWNWNVESGWSRTGNHLQPAPAGDKNPLTSVAGYDNLQLPAPASGYIGQGGPAAVFDGYTDPNQALYSGGVPLGTDYYGLTAGYPPVNSNAWLNNNYYRQQPQAEAALRAEQRTQQQPQAEAALLAAQKAQQQQQAEAALLAAQKAQQQQAEAARLAAQKRAEEAAAAAAAANNHKTA
jgi:hypothetical protein